MNCEKFLAVASDLARNQMMEASERASAETHLAECVYCRTSLSDQRELSERLRTLAVQMKSTGAPEHIEARLLADFRDQNRVRPVPAAPNRGRYWMTAAAAVLLMGFALLAWRWQVTPVKPPISQSAAVPPSEPKQLETPTVVVAGIHSPPQPKIGTALRGLARRHSAAAQLAKRGGSKQTSVDQTGTVTENLEAKELTTEFVPVGYGSALDLQDGGQLVRVELPRSALATFGLPMNMDRAGERIKADVLVGTDGLARAIRFVETKPTNKD